MPTSAVDCGPLCASTSDLSLHKKAGLSDQAAEFLNGLLSSSDWPARWHCGSWSNLHGWLYIVSDLMIWAAYFAIPVLLIRLVFKRKDLPFSKIFWLFGAFIILCGTTHFIDAAMFWWPAYRINALVRLMTALVSVFTVISLYRILPQMLSMRTVQELEHEINERRIAEQKLAASEFLLAEAGRIGRVGGWQVDAQTKELSWSKTIYEIYELPIDYVIKLDEVMTFFAEPYKKQIEDALQNAYQSGLGWDLELQIFTAKNSRKWVRSYGEPFFDQNGKLVQIRGVFMDIDRYKTSELALNQSVEDLRRSNDNLQQFAYVASHDLQEPLRKIRAFGDLLANRYDKQLGEGITYLQRMQQAAGRMSVLINDLLAFAAISTRKDTILAVSLQEVVKSVLTDLELVIQETNAKVIIGHLPTMPGDKTQLGQLFQNLLTNALKFRHTDRDPVIEITSVMLAASELPDAIKPGRITPFYYRIDLSDNGIGFDPKHAGRIFQVFQRLHGKQEFSGTGIGLAICEKVVANHGGAIVAGSTPGQGATFSLYLPAD